MKNMDVPNEYISGPIDKIRKIRDAGGTRKDYAPTFLDFGPVQIYLARHFGFCLGVKEAIQKASKIVNENSNKRIFLLSEIIHNPTVNNDFLKKGVKFVQDTDGSYKINLDELTSDDVVIIPAFGTTLEMEQELKTRNIEIENSDTTCRFVKKVWKKGFEIGQKGYTIVIHGKPEHEETKATFSHAVPHAPTIIIRNMDEAVELGKYIVGLKTDDEFYSYFKNRCSAEFNFRDNLKKIGVINQTTQLETDTLEIIEYLKNLVPAESIGDFNEVSDYFANTSDTLCYATSDNQLSVKSMLGFEADFALVVGGHKSSNTSHLVEICEDKLPTYYIDSQERIDISTIENYKWRSQEIEEVNNYLPNKKPVKILMTGGASCPDKDVESVINKLLSFYPECLTFEEVVDKLSY